MNQEQNHGPSKARHLAPGIAGIVAIVIIGWIIMNSNKTDTSTAMVSPATRVIQTLSSVQISLADADTLAKKINDNHLVSGWRMFESYVINRQESMFQTPDSPDLYPEHLSLLTKFVAHNEAIATSLNSLPERSISPSLVTEVTAFNAYARRLSDRLAALPNSVETGDALPPVVSMPKNFSAMITAEIERLKAI